MPRRDKQPSKFGPTSEDRMEAFRQSLEQDFGDMDLRNENHLKELMRDRTVKGERRGYRRFYDKEGEERFGVPTPIQTQIAWNYLKGEYEKKAPIRLFNFDKYGNKHATTNTSWYNPKRGKTINYRRGMFLPKLFQ